MLAVLYQDFTESIGKVTGWYNIPEGVNIDELSMQQGTLVVNALPRPMEVVPYGKEIEYQVLLPQKVLSYIIVESPLSYDEKLNLLQNENLELKVNQVLLQKAVDDLLMGGI